MSDDNPTLPVPWKIGEHVAAVGDTGTGKTYLLAKLVEQRNYVVVIRTKPDDIKWPGFKHVRKASAMDGMYDTRLLLAPEHSYQMREAYAALNRAWEQGGWTIVVDELWYMEKMLKLGALTDRLLTQGRSKKLTVVVGMQRPAQISRFAISQCTHLFTFRIEGRDLQIVKESTTPRIVEPIENLRGHHFVYYNRSQRLVATGDANSLDRVITGTSQNIRRGT